MTSTVLYEASFAYKWLALETNIGLYGTQVIPRVRELLAGEGSAGPSALQCVVRRHDNAR